MFDWMKYHSLAAELCAGLDPAAHRSAVSRAYYAVFHLACGYAERRGASLPRYEKHAALWQWFDPPDPAPGRTRNERRIGRDGKRLRQRRNDADYEAGADVTGQLVDSMRLARALLEALAEQSCT